MKKFLFVLIILANFVAQADVAQKLGTLSSALQVLAGKIKPSLKIDKDPVEKVIDKLIKIDRKGKWSPSDVKEYSSLLTMLQASGVSYERQDQYQQVYEQRKGEATRPMPQPPTPIDKKSESKGGKRKPPMRPAQRRLNAFKNKETVTQKEIKRARKDLETLKGIGKTSQKELDKYEVYIAFHEEEVEGPPLLPTPEDKEEGIDRPLPDIPEGEEPDEMALALLGLKEISQKGQWAKEDAAAFTSLLEIIKKGRAPADLIKQYTDELAKRKEAEEAKVKGIIPPPPPGLFEEKVTMRPSFIHPPVIKRILGKEAQPIQSAVYWQELSAAIGINGAGNLIVFGPKLKQKPTRATFFEKGAFVYPDIYAIEIEGKAGEPVKADYYIYTVVFADQVDALNMSLDPLDQEIYSYYTILKETKKEPKRGEENRLDYLDSMIQRNNDEWMELDFNDPNNQDIIVRIRNLLKEYQGLKEKLMEGQPVFVKERILLRQKFN